MQRGAHSGTALTLPQTVRRGRRRLQENALPPQFYPQHCGHEPEGRQSTFPEAHDVPELPAFRQKLLEDVSHQHEGTKHKKGRRGVTERGAPTPQSKGKPREVGDKADRGHGDRRKRPEAMLRRARPAWPGGWRPAVGGGPARYDPWSHRPARFPGHNHHLLVSSPLTLLEVSCHPQGTKAETRLPGGHRAAWWPGSAPGPHLPRSVLLRLEFYTQPTATEGDTSSRVSQSKEFPFLSPELTKGRAPPR